MTLEELIRAAANCDPSKRTIKEIAARLPDEMHVVEQLIETAIKDRDEAAFNHLYIAGIVRGFVHYEHNRPIISGSAERFYRHETSLHAEGDLSATDRR